MLSVTELSMAAQALQFQASVLDQVKLSPFPTAADNADFDWWRKQEAG